MSRPRPSRALIVESRRPGLRAQNMCIFTALPSLTLTSTYREKNMQYTEITRYYKLKTRPIKFLFVALSSSIPKKLKNNMTTIVVSSCTEYKLCNDHLVYKLNMIILLFSIPVHYDIIS